MIARRYPFEANPEPPSAKRISLSSRITGLAPVRFIAARYSSCRAFVIPACAGLQGMSSLGRQRPQLAIVPRPESALIMSRRRSKSDRYLVNCRTSDASLRGRKLWSRNHASAISGTPTRIAPATYRFSHRYRFTLGGARIGVFGVSTVLIKAQTDSNVEFLNTRLCDAHLVGWEGPLFPSLPIVDDYEERRKSATTMLPTMAERTICYLCYGPNPVRYFSVFAEDFNEAITVVVGRTPQNSFCITNFEFGRPKRSVAVAGYVDLLCCPRLAIRKAVQNLSMPDFQ